MDRLEEFAVKDNDLSGIVLGGSWIEANRSRVKIDLVPHQGEDIAFPLKARMRQELRERKKKRNRRKKKSLKKTLHDVEFVKALSGGPSQKQRDELTKKLEAAPTAKEFAEFARNDLRAEKILHKFNVI